ncbi:hypothetical protein SAMN05421788_102157 [Filimonas lacunae]|uniref:Probable membrane transporter protein n=1 Tax=Filimonas lacunae TaxID=477680 RepID=A0A173MHW9_9BACT|nr:sulfite exporter TauE/SafE family protein [Filimonas lacunae]BAV07222.1 hypothetical protein FLA_3245 [Filimonas lacunae]SIS93028.1 hypothetical protein SAMN05421788_102157 [Filimonas lacunae]
MLTIIAGYLSAILVGLSLGLIGGGGSILTVPILVFCFRIDPVLATTYSLCIVGLTSAVGAFRHYRNGNVILPIALLFGIPSLITVFVMRKWIMPSIPRHICNIGHHELIKPDMLMATFACLMIFTALAMIRKKKTEDPINENIAPNKPLLVGQSILVGGVTGFIGVGGGFLIIPSLVMFARIPVKKAIGTSLLIMTMSSLLGVLGDVSRHVDMNMSFLVSFSACTITGILAGAYASKFIQDKALKQSFGWFVLCMGLFMMGRFLLHG